MRELSGAIDVCKSMKGTYSQWINVLLWLRRLGLSFFFSCKKVQFAVICCSLPSLPFRSLPCSEH
jgi:hypothetical protein